MPYINLTTTEKINDQTAKALKEQLGEAISLLPGKTEQWLMINLDGEKTLSFAGVFEPCAIADIAIFGSSTSDAYNKLTAKVTEILEENLNLPADKIYVSYSERNIWGWNGSNL